VGWIIAGSFSRGRLALRLAASVRYRYVGLMREGFVSHPAPIKLYGALGNKDEKLGN
jgi:hypothetical protein